MKTSNLGCPYIKRIFVCKCLCKTWYDLISNPEFANLHFDQAQVYPGIRTSRFTILSRLLFLVHPEQDDFVLKLDRHHSSPQCKLGCVCNVKVKLDTKFILPLCTLEKIVNDKNDDDSRRNNGLKLNMKDQKHDIVNSCNGLLHCLFNPTDNEHFIVCNPVTGEFINLPEECTVKDSCILDVACGFGFSLVTNQYKVIRMFAHWSEDGECDNVVAEIHILGTKSWKHLGFFPYTLEELIFPTYSNR